MTHYEKQVRILLRVLPLIEYNHPESGAPFMALKGGTALNFLLWNLPRLSVDIDLAYCPIDDREIAVRDITASMQRLAPVFGVEPLAPVFGVEPKYRF